MQKRLKSIIERIGETYTVNSSSHMGVITILNPTAARDYLTQTDIDAAPRPMRLIYTAYDDTTAVGNVVTWNSQSFTIRKAIDVRYLNATIARVLVAY